MSRRRVLLKKAGNPAQYTLRDQRNSFSSVHVSPAHYAYTPWAEDDGVLDVILSLFKQYEPQASAA
ncbi:MAG: hypothetical protein IPP74_00450 [Alphaproteobacteria bacterium]|nr:hypothetical protein [Alphaproteobacteria bacterium]